MSTVLFKCENANALYEKLMSANKDNKKAFFLSFKDFENISVDDLEKILSLTNICAITSETIGKKLISKRPNTGKTRKYKSNPISNLTSNPISKPASTPALMPIVNITSNPISKPASTPALMPIINITSNFSIKPSIKPIKKSSDKKLNEIDISGMPQLIPCTLEEERYIIEQIALIEISKLGKHNRIYIDVSDD